MEPVGWVVGVPDPPRHELDQGPEKPTITWRSDRWNHGRYGSTDEVRQCGVRTPTPPVLRRRDEDIIGTVVAQASMSLDGYVAKADNSIGRPFD
jgi:hypothetical protein